MKLCRRISVLLLCICLLSWSAEATVASAADFVPAQDNNPQTSAPPLSQQELDQLVAPIALYPDALVAQVLAASTYPTEIVEAERWMKSHSNLHGDDLAKEVDKQPWDPSVKALTQFPSVLENMDSNLSWTSSLGDAYANQPQDVTDAVQALRQKAKDAGQLNTNAQEKITTQGSTIVIEPADPQVVYVPAYDPWLVYGGPIIAYPGWVPVPGVFFGGPFVSFGIGFGIGFFAGYGWGWHNWGCDWGGHRVIFNHTTFISHSHTIINRGGFHGSPAFNHGGGFNNGFRGGDRGFGGASGFHGDAGLHSGAFSGFDRGGDVRGFSSRGMSSFGGGFHGGGRR